MTNASIWFNSIHGPIMASWTYDPASARYSLTATVPPNVTAAVYIPTANNLAGITENAFTSGLAATNAPGVLYYYCTNAPNWGTNGATVFKVSSGTYNFSVNCNF